MSLDLLSDIISDPLGSKYRICVKEKGSRLLRPDARPLTLATKNQMYSGYEYSTLATETQTVVDSQCTRFQQNVQAGSGRKCFIASEKVAQCPTKSISWKRSHSFL